jgi:hypothetical protein
LSTATGLPAGNIIAVLVVNVNPVKVLIFDNVDKGGRKLIFPTKAVIPAIILVTFKQIRTSVVRQDRDRGKGREESQSRSSIKIMELKLTTP